MMINLPKNKTMKYFSFLLFIFTFVGLVFFSISPNAQQSDIKTKIARLAGGCFWCLESDFDKLDGIVRTTSGYSGGTIPNPTYENYHDKIEGFEPHVEVVEIEYNPEKISYEQIVHYHFKHIDPTDGKGQFCDRGAAYRPVIYVKNDEERATAEKISDAVEADLNQKVAVDILDAKQFWAAEDYHQNYYKKNSIRYNLYRWKCGRDQRIEDLWGTTK